MGLEPEDITDKTGEIYDIGLDDYSDIERVRLDTEGNVYHPDNIKRFRVIKSFNSKSQQRDIILSKSFLTRLKSSI